MMTNVVLRRICINFHVHAVVQNFNSMKCMGFSCRTVTLAQLGISFYTLDPLAYMKWASLRNTEKWTMSSKCQINLLFLLLSAYQKETIILQSYNPFSVDKRVICIISYTIANADVEILYQL